MLTRPLRVAVLAVAVVAVLAGLAHAPVLSGRAISTSGGLQIGHTGTAEVAHPVSFIVQGIPSCALQGV